MTVIKSHTEVLGGNSGDPMISLVRLNGLALANFKKKATVDIQPCQKLHLTRIN
jgi:hypothetical protein